MSEFIQISTTTDTQAQATQIARSLVEKRLAACVQISGPLSSVYRWQGKIEQADEWRCSVKTRKAFFSAVEATILEIHSYDCPEILAVPILVGNSDYLDWLNQQLQASPTD